jgi:riboflavin kinase / FMN adenylyltransferase
MMVVRSVEAMTRVPGSVITVGTFDGVHRGHQDIIRTAVQHARTRGSRVVLVTFDPHPKEVVASHYGPVALLSTLDERIPVFANLGVDVVLVIQFTFAFSRQSAAEFYERCLVGPVGVAEVVVGHDHSFGRDREGSLEQLRELGKQFGFAVEVVGPRLLAGEPVSSSRIRRTLLAGDVRKAEELLGRPYALQGTVEAGDGRGRTIGFPTANIATASDKKLIPARGVYVVEAELGDGRFQGMMNIGLRPTVTDAGKLTLEVHLLGVDRNLVGEHVTVRFRSRLRDEQKFPSLDALVRQLQADREATKSFFDNEQHQP